MRTTKRIWTFFLIALAIPLIGYSQSTVESGVFLNAESATLSPNADGTVEIFAQNLKEETRNVALIKTPYGDGRALVRAYNQAKPFPPRTLQGSAGTFILDVPGVFDIEIIAIDESGAWQTEYLESVTVEGFDPIPDPKPDPVEGKLAELARELLQTVNDPGTSAKYASALGTIDFQSSDLDEMKFLVGKARRDVFNSGTDAPWYRFFEPMDKELGKYETAESYRSAWKVLIKVLREFGETASKSVMEVWAPPPLPHFVGQVHMGRVLIKQCDSSGCRFIWVPQ